MVEVNINSDINDSFSRFSIKVAGKEVPLNVIGVLQDTEKARHFVVLHNMEGLVSDEEYVIVEMIQEESISLVELSDDKLYNDLCELWELHLARLEV